MNLIASIETILQKYEVSAKVSYEQIIEDIMEVVDKAQEQEYTSVTQQGPDNEREVLAWDGSHVFLAFYKYDRWWHASDGNALFGIILWTEFKRPNT